MSLEQIYKTNRKVWRWQRDSNIGGLAGGILMFTGALTANHPVMAVGLAVMVTARMGGEWIVETLKKNVVVQQKNMVEGVGDTSSVEIMREAEEAQSIRPKVRTAISSAYIALGGSIVCTPLLASAPTEGMFIASMFVGTAVGFTAARFIEQSARKKFRFYDNAPDVATTVAKTAVEEFILKDKVLENRVKSNSAVAAPKTKM